MLMGAEAPGYEQGLRDIVYTDNQIEFFWKVADQLERSRDRRQPIYAGTAFFLSSLNAMSSRSMPIRSRSAVNLPFLLSFAALRMRSSALLNDGSLARINRARRRDKPRA